VRTSANTGDPLIYWRVCVGTDSRGIVSGDERYLASRAVHNPIF
jgi:hypothetical protein